MTSFIVELVLKPSFNWYPNNTLSSHTIFLPEQIIFEGEWEVLFTELSYPSLYQKIIEGKLDETTPDAKPSNYYTLYSGLYLSISDIVHEINKHVQEREKTPIRLHVKITKRVSFSIPNELIAIFSADLCHLFRCEEAGTPEWCWSTFSQVP